VKNRGLRKVAAGFIWHKAVDQSTPNQRAQ